MREVLGLQEGTAGGPTRPIATPSLAWERNWQPNAAAPSAASAYIGAGAVAQSGGRAPSYTPGMQSDPIPSDTTSAALDESFVEDGWNRGPSHNGGHRLCILVPFRDSADKTSQGANRTENLMEFIPYMIRHLTDNAGMMRISSQCASGNDGAVMQMTESNLLSCLLPSLSFLSFRSRAGSRLRNSDHRANAGPCVQQRRAVQCRIFCCQEGRL